MGLRLWQIQTARQEGQTVNNVYWPRRPDLCNKDGRVCTRYEEREFRAYNADGVYCGYIRVAGDVVIALLRGSGLTLVDTADMDRGVRP